MTQQDVPVGMELGYFFHHRERPNAPGHPQLDVLMRSVPTEKHFDPEQLSLTVASEHRGTEFLRVHHPWSWLEQYRVCAGRVILKDRKDKKVGAFTFGGDLHIESEEMLTTCFLTSPAPILELIGTSSIPVLLAVETEIIFAKRRAEWVHDPAIYDKRLSAADPLILYIACLEAIGDKFERYPSRGDEFIQQFVQFIRVEIKTLHELHEWPLYVPRIDELL